LRSILPVFTIGADLVAGNQSHAGYQIVRVYDQEITLWVKSIPTPVHAADIARNSKSALQAGRGKDTFIAELSDSFLTGFTVSWRWPPRIFHRKVLWREGRGKQRKGLSRRRLLAGNIALGYGPLFDRENWFACVTIEHIQKPCLVSLDDNGNSFSIVWQCRQEGR
jgi:hypothetical protein